jgi:hypothetical protein
MYPEVFSESPAAALFGSGYVRKSARAAGEAPMPSGSSALTWAGVSFPTDPSLRV